MIKIKYIFHVCTLLILASCGRSGKLTHDYYGADNAETANVRMQITHIAAKYMGVPYRDAGRTPTKGFDCSGFVSYVYDQVKIDFDGSAQSMSKFGVLKAKASLQPGDLVYFGKGQDITHMGIIVSNTTKGLVMIHSSSSAGVSKVNLSTSTYWKPLYLFGKDIFRKS